jgi:hypothetical protein
MVCLMDNQQPSAKRELTRAIVNVILGDGHFWKHPECNNYKLVWSSINRDWLEWKARNLLPTNLVGSINARERKEDRCFSNAKTLYTLQSKVHSEFTDATTLSPEWALSNIDDVGVACWFLDDGCTVKRPDSSGYRVTISVGTGLSLKPDTVIDWAKNYYNTNEVGRVYKNNSRASENNKSWIIPKAIAIQILRSARDIVVPSMQYKVPVW